MEYALVKLESRQLHTGTHRKLPVDNPKAIYLGKNNNIELKFRIVTQTKS